MNDNELEDKIILYKKIEDNNYYELDKDNLILNAFILKYYYYFNYLVFLLLYQ